MIVLRLILVIALAAIAGLILAWMVTKDRKYLLVAGRIGRFLIVFAVVVALIYIAERLVLI